MTERRLRVVEPATEDLGVAGLRALARALLPYLKELLVQEQQAAELVDVVSFVPAAPRVIMRDCRNGKIVGARKVGRKWIAPRVAVEAWLRERGPRVVRRRKDDGLDDLRARVAKGSR